MRVLVLNAGSGSEKASLYDLDGGADADAPAEPLWQGQIDWVPHGGRARMSVETGRGAKREEEVAPDSRPDGLARLLRTVWEGPTAVLGSPAEIDAVGHRVVHGGREYEAPTVVTPEVKAAIARLSALAPLHNPAALEGIEAVAALLGDVPQVAVFDTSFHSRLPEEVAAYAGPYAWLEHGIRRYGFHGISHEYAAHRAAQLLQRELADLRLVTCHLGNGCSLAAVRSGHSVDTTMGFTPLEGLMMAKRSGSVDPGILLYLQREQGLTMDQVDHTLNEESGLLGISGVGADMRQVMAATRQGNARASLAYAMFVHSVRRHIGAMLASLGGLDALIFTGGIGENAASVRGDACAAFGFLGLRLDATRNEAAREDADVATDDSAVRVLVVRAQENQAVARAVVETLGRHGHNPPSGG